MPFAVGSDKLDTVEAVDGVAEMTRGTAQHLPYLPYCMDCRAPTGGDAVDVLGSESLLDGVSTSSSTRQPGVASWILG